MKPTYDQCIMHEVKKMWDRVNADPLADRNEALKKERALVDLALSSRFPFAFLADGKVVSNDQKKFGGFSKAYVCNENGRVVVLPSKAINTLFSISLIDKATFAQACHDWEARCEAEISASFVTVNAKHGAKTITFENSSPICDCGGTKARTTHADYCTLKEKGLV